MNVKLELRYTDKETHTKNRTILVDIPEVGSLAPTPHQAEICEDYLQLYKEPDEEALRWRLRKA